LGTPTKEELELINSRFAKTPLSADDVYVWTSAVSNTLVDSYGTAQHPETLDDYLNDIKQGVARMVGHEVRGKIPIGRTFDGYIEQYEPLANGHPHEVLFAKSYMLRGQRLADDLTTDDIITGIEAGTVFAESIGFADRPGAIEATYECSICGTPYERFGWWLTPRCKHVAGRWYDSEGNELPEGEGRFNHLWIRNAQLVEISLVYAGAAQDAKVQRSPYSRTMGVDVPLRVGDVVWTRTEAKGDKPGSMDTSTYQNTVTGHRLCHLYWRRWKGGSPLPKNWTEGHLKREHTKCVRALLEKYNGSHTMRDGLDDTLPQDLKKKSKGGDRMPDEEMRDAQEPANDAGSVVDEAVRSVAVNVAPIAQHAAEPPKDERADILAQARSELGLAEDADLLGAIRDLKKHAERGKAAREKAEKEALEWGVRAMGNDFPKSVFEKQIASMSDEELEVLRNSFESQAHKAIPNQRVTQAPELSLNSSLSIDEKARKEAEKRLAAIGELKKEG